MTQMQPSSLHQVPTAEQFSQAVRQRDRQFLLWGTLLAVVVACSFLISPILPVVLLVGLLGLAALWKYARLSLYVTFAAACLFELSQTPYSDALTDRVPFFWNLNAVFRTYARANIDVLPLNLFEVLILTAGAFAFIRAVFTRSFNIRAGSLFWPIFIYIGFVAMGAANGIMTGGDFKLALWEVRAQFYFLLIYLLAVNSVRERRHLDALLWTMALSIGLKGILYTLRRYVTLRGVPLPEQGVGSHEEAFFFTAFMLLLPVLMLCGTHKRLQQVMWGLLPFVVLGNLATNRRTATAALVIALPILLVAAYQALPERRRIVGRTALILTAVIGIYLPAFWNRDGMIAQPAQAIKSQFLEERTGSDLYRDAENQCIMATIRVAPLQGYGYGKRMLHAVPIADISHIYEWWDLIPHNTVLWVWMRVGTVGFLAFWVMLSAITVRACLTFRDKDADATAKAVGIFAVLSVAALLIVGLYDMQLAGYRNMLFVGCWTGMVAAIPSLTGQSPGQKPETD